MFLLALRIQKKICYLQSACNVRLSVHCMMGWQSLILGKQNNGHARTGVGLRPLEPSVVCEGLGIRVRYQYLVLRALSTPAKAITMCTNGLEKRENDKERQLRNGPLLKRSLEIW